MKLLLTSAGVKNASIHERWRYFANHPSPAAPPDTSPACATT
jgi:hypothetical protein